MKWRKAGLIFEPPRNLGWMVTHAALPCADRVGDDYRIYFSGRDDQGRSRIGYFDANLDDSARVLRVSEEPVVGLGPLGTFDDHGVTSSWIVSRDGAKYLYYTGWNLGVTVPFYFFVGLAVSTDEGKSFQKVSRGPVLERCDVDPFLTASPCVLIEGGVWRMWYVSGTGWDATSNGPRHSYHIKYAESVDGVQWRRKGIICIDYASPEEYAIARPCVVKDRGGYRMWYSCRGQRYRLGYAESADGIGWTRKDQEAGLDVSAGDWDAEMVAYPFVFDHGGKRYMLYNGNGYGQTGIGLAVLAQDR